MLKIHRKHVSGLVLRSDHKVGSFVYDGVAGGPSIIGQQFVLSDLREDLGDGLAVATGGNWPIERPPIIYFRLCGEPDVPPGKYSCPACSSPISPRVVRSMNRSGVWDELVSYATARMLMGPTSDDGALYMANWRRVHDLCNDIRNGLDVVDWEKVGLDQQEMPGRGRRRNGGYQPRREPGDTMSDAEMLTHPPESD